jgi:gluconokinase
VSSETPTRPVVLIFMGVAGSGKTTIAKLFAEKSGAIFFEGDDFHPPANVAKMRAGIPLTDDDRVAWLQTLRKIITRALQENKLTALTCSALKAKYREELAANDPRVQFVHLTGAPELIEERLKNRRGHFMPPTLLASQFAILESPTDALVFDSAMSPEKIVAKLLQTLDIAVRP